jgi:hypothetical protein
MKVNPTNYIAEWMRIFDHVLNWSPYQTLQWIDRNELERGLDTSVAVETTLYWAIPEFIPIKLRRNLSVKEILAIRHDIWQLYLKSASYGNPNRDYKPFREDLNRYLKAKYQMELDAPAHT